MIYTLTTNPAIDMNFKIDHLAPATVMRTSPAQYTPNGKGVNVTLVLKHFLTQSTAVGFFGGFTGDYILTRLAEMDIPTHSVAVEDDTRINIFVNAGDEEYKFVNPGPPVSLEKQAEMIAYLDTRQDLDVLVISGSLPTGIDPTYYDQILTCCQKNGTRVVLDISSPHLKNLLQYRPLLIKPNDDEVAEIFGISVKTQAEAIATCYLLHEKGAQNILLTMGEKGLYFCDGKNVFFVTAPKVTLVSSACAGDTCLATFLSDWLAGKNVEDALIKASAAGADAAASEGIGTLSRVSSYMNQIEVRKVSTNE